ncbi:MAG: uroporphyrinogen-III synthase [Polyangiaceae bacterium]
MIDGVRVLVMRSDGQRSALEELLVARGAVPVVVPLLAFRAIGDAEAVVRTAATIGTRDWVVFTSANGVAFTARAIAASAGAREAVRRARIAAIGPGTAAAVRGAGWATTLVAEESRAEGLVEALLQAEADAPSGTAPRAVLFRALRARDVVPDALRAAGWTVDVVAVYETHVPEGAHQKLREALGRGEVDALVLTSASTAEHLADALAGGEGGAADTARLLAGTKVASIGPVTTAAAEKRGLRVDGTARAYTMSGLVELLETRLFARA